MPLFRTGQIDLASLYLNDTAARETIRSWGHERVKENYTYRHRWETILSTVFA